MLNASVRRGVVALVLATALVPSGLSAQFEERVDYATEIQPLLADFCYSCHGANRATREADLRLDEKEASFEDRGGYHMLVPGEPDESELYLRVASEFAEDRMPPYNSGFELNPGQIDLLKRWIEQGADWPDELATADAVPERRRRRPSGIPTVALPDGEFLTHTHDIVDVRVVVMTKGLSHPWSLAFLPKGDILVTERSGDLRLVRDGVLVPEPISGVPTDIIARGLSGLMEVAVHPDYEENGWIYLTYTRDLTTTGTVALVRGRLDGTRFVDVEDVFQAKPWVGEVPADNPSVRLSSTAASRLAFGLDGTLFMTMGGAFGVEREDGTHSFFGNAGLAQDPGSHAGKLLRINDDGTAPKDNPFYGKEGALPEVYTLGHRNQQGLTVHPVTGQPWATEHAPQGGDELNLLLPGGNYGWPVASHSRYYDGPRTSRAYSLEGMEDPAVLWIPSVAPSGLTFYTGDAFPEWKGNLFAGAMMVGRVPRTGNLQRIVFNEDFEEMRRESILAEVRQRIRDVRQGPDGLLYLITEEVDAALLRLEPVDP